MKDLFVTGTDTEVILKAYAAWGPESLRRLRGMFAFAIWDAKSRRTLLARERRELTERLQRFLEQRLKQPLDLRITTPQDS